MNTPLEQKFKNLVDRFRLKVQKDLILIAPITVNFNFQGQTITKTFRKEQLKTALNTACPASNTKNHKKQCEAITDLLETIKFDIGLSSSNLAFRRAWNSQSDELSQSEIDAIANEGGQLIPAQPVHSHRLYKEPKMQESGLIKFPTGNGPKLLRAVRHVPGNFEDELSVFGVLQYQTDRDAAGIFSYRFIEEFSREFQVEFPIQLLTRFKSPVPNKKSIKEHKDRIRYFFVTTFASVSINDNNKWDAKWFTSPLNLKLTSINEIRKSINYISDLSIIPHSGFKIRTPLSSQLENDWNYNKISSNSMKRGIAIRKWAQSVKLSCPDGSGPKCVKTLDLEKNYSKIHVGHIISQYWAQAYSFLNQFPNNTVNHPDNLYLSCSSCNQSLNKNFPDNNTRAKIENKALTVGDLLRNNLNSIMNFI